MEYLQVGKVANIHGNKGELKVVPLVDNIERFNELKKIYIGMEKEITEIEKVSFKKGQVLCKIKGINNIQDAEELIGKFFWIKREDAKKDKDAFFIFEMIGIEVWTLENEYIGKISEVLQPGANDVYVIENGDSEYLIPGIKQVVKSVNIEDKKMIIYPLKGMIE